MAHTVRITQISNGIETVVHQYGPSTIREAANRARIHRDSTGFETRVYDDDGLRGVMDARS